MKSYFDRNVEKYDKSSRQMFSYTSADSNIPTYLFT